MQYVRETELFMEQYTDNEAHETWVAVASYVLCLSLLQCKQRMYQYLIMPTSLGTFNRFYFLRVWCISVYV